MVSALIKPPFFRVKVEVSIVTLPPFPCAVSVTSLDSRAFSPTVTPWVALIATLPALPLPLVSALIKPPFSRVKVAVSIVIPPLFPCAVPFTSLDSHPRTLTPWVALIATLPALPLPLVSALIKLPFSRVKVAVSIVIPPLFPCAVSFTSLDSTAFSPTVTPWLALIATFPALPLPLVSALIKLPFSRVKFAVSIVTLPPFPSLEAAKTPVLITLPFFKVKDELWILISPAFPLPNSSTILAIAALSRVTCSILLISIFPA